LTLAREAGDISGRVAPRAVKRLRLQLVAVRERTAPLEWVASRRRYAPLLHLLGGLGLALGLFGCARAPDVELLELSEVRPARLSPGKSLRVEGRGFPVDGAGTLRFEGRRRNPGHAAAEVAYEARVRVGHDGAVRLPVTDALLRAMGGRSTFRGRLRLSFPQAEGGGRVYGLARDVVLDFLPPTGEDLALDLARDRRGRRVAERLGVTLDEEEREAGGLVVTAVREGGAAARLGLGAGDRLVAMDGLRLYSVGDLVPPPGIEATVVEVIRAEDRARAGRAGDPVPATVTFPLLVASDLPGASQLWWVAVIGALLWILAFVAPTARITAALARKPPPSDEGTLAWLFFAPTGAPGGRRRGLLRLGLLGLGVLAVSLAFAGVALAGRAFESDFGVGVLLTSALALRLTARIMDDAPIELSLKLLAVAVVGAPLSIAVICVCLLVGTGHLGHIHEAQGGLPFRWLVFHHPIAFGLFPVFAATALGRVETGTRVAGIAARAHLLVVSCLGAAIFLGGWNAPFPDGPHPVTWGVVAFVAKCWALIFVGLWARRLGPGAGGVWKWAVPISLLGLVASTLWLAVDVPPEIEATSGPLLTALAASVGLYVLHRRLTRRPETLRLYPFL
jgi:hypothetical protein